MGRRDPLEIIEAAYSFDTTESEWVQGIARAAGAFDQGLGVVAYVADLRAKPSYRSAHIATPMATLEQLEESARHASPEYWRHIHAPGPVAFGHDVAALMGKDVPIPQVVQGMMAQGMGIWTLAGGDSKETFCLILPCENRNILTLPRRRALSCVGAHLGAALRIRSALSRAPRAEDKAVEAVVSPSGKLLHARGAEAQAGASTLVSAVQRLEHARRRSASPEERLATWTALVDGRWSILETSESDGKRLLLAMKNEPRTFGMRALTKREKSVVAYVALGHSYKYIGYELGISAPTVSATVTRALRKLGIASRAELIRTFG
jgi:DNA-binding CsgD family transcriptional regulator